MALRGRDLQGVSSVSTTEKRGQYWTQASYAGKSMLMPCSANGLCQISAQSDIMGEPSRHLADRFKDTLHVDLPFPTLRTMDRKAGRWLRRRRGGTPAPVQSCSVIRCTRRLFSPRLKAHTQAHAHKNAPPLKLPSSLDFSKHLSSAHEEHLECPRRGRRWLRRSR